MYQKEGRHCLFGFLWMGDVGGSFAFFWIAWRLVLIMDGWVAV